MGTLRISWLWILRNVYLIICKFLKISLRWLDKRIRVFYMICLNRHKLFHRVNETAIAVKNNKNWLYYSTWCLLIDSFLNKKGNHCVIASTILIKILIVKIIIHQHVPSQSRVFKVLFTEAYKNIRLEL